MTNLEKKINILLKIANNLNNNNITWAIGGSLSLYLYKIVDTFNDIDIMVKKEDFEKTKEILLIMGTMTPKNDSNLYTTSCFNEFVIEECDIDLMANVSLSNSNYCLSLEENDINYIKIKDICIPIHSLKKWEIFYQMIERKAKAEMINNYLKKETQQ